MTTRHTVRSLTTEVAALATRCTDLADRCAKLEAKLAALAPRPAPAAAPAIPQPLYTTPSEARARRYATTCRDNGNDVRLARKGDRFYVFPR